MVRTSAIRSSPTGTRRNARRGLTLFEVLLSLAILAAAMAAIAQLVSSGVQSSVRARLQTEAIIRCQSRMAELIAVGDPTAVVTEVPFDDDPAWKWSVSSAATEQPGLLQVVVTVTHDAGNGFSDVSYSIPRLYRDTATMVSSSTSTSDDSSEDAP